MNLVRPSKQTIDTRSKSAITNTHTLHTLSSSITGQKELNQFTKQIQVQRRKYMDEEKNYNSILKELQVEKILYRKLKIQTQNTNIKAIPKKINYLSHSIQKFTSNDKIKNKISKLKETITVQRKQQNKYKLMCGQLNQLISGMQQSIMNTNDRIQLLKRANQQIKQQILKLREKSKQDSTNFKLNMMSARTTYYSEKKQIQHQKKDFAILNVETFALPVLKRRLKGILKINEDKIKIIDQYQKVSGQINQMFEIISSYTGKEDIPQIVQQFVDKQKIILKLQQQSAKLEQELIHQQKNSNEQINEIRGLKPLCNQKEKQILDQQIKLLEGTILQRKKSQEIITMLFKNSLKKIRQSDIKIRNPKLLQQKIGESGYEYIYEILGEIQKYIDTSYPLQASSNFNNNILNISSDSDQEMKQTKKIDIEVLPDIDGNKQQLMRYEDLITIANQAIFKIKDSPQKQTTKLSN